MLVANEPDSIPRRATRNLDFDGGDWSLDVAALPCRSWRSVRESGGENLLHHLRIPDYDAAVEGIQQNLKHSSARVLCAEGVPDPACSNRLHAAGVRDLLARVALVSHGGGGVVCNQFRLRASVVPGTLVVAERGGTVLFLVAGGAEEVAPAPGGDFAGSGGVRSGLSGGVPPAEAARARGRDVSGSSRHPGDGMPAGHFCAAPAPDQVGPSIADGGAGDSGSGIRGGSAVPHDAGPAACALALVALLDCRTVAARSADSLLDIE